MYGKSMIFFRACRNRIGSEIRAKTASGSDKKISDPQHCRFRQSPSTLISKINLNPKPHGRGRICPHYFQWPITQNSLSEKNQHKLSVPRKTSAESLSWVMYTSKNADLCLFWPQNRPMPEKWGLTVYVISQGFLIFAHIEVGGGGRAAESTKQVENPFMAKVWLFIC